VSKFFTRRNQIFLGFQDKLENESEISNLQRVSWHSSDNPSEDSPEVADARKKINEYKGYYRKVRANMGTTVFWLQQNVDKGILSDAERVRKKPMGFQALVSRIARGDFDLDYLLNEQRQQAKDELDEMTTTRMPEAFSFFRPNDDIEELSKNKAKGYQTRKVNTARSGPLPLGDSPSISGPSWP